MTDQNRGAYTPQSDAPLSFDARRAGGSRGPMPITLIFSVLILLALLVGGGVAILYHNGARKAGEPPQPVGEAVGSMKAAPEMQNAPAARPQEAATTGAPNFTPPPEQPAARPIETTPLPPPPAPPKATTQPVGQPTAVPEPKPEAAKPAPVAKAEPVRPAPVAKTAAPKVAEAAPKTAPAPKTAAAGSFTVQIGAYSTSALAANGWNEVAKMMPGEMAGKTREVDTVQRDGKTLYRARIGGFASRGEAERMC
ncbi:MAG TPA: SPOR domain-containing protein, partial [Caulobacteraceae bacterium]|nr:SPOR domain-containing protein [Caulobacteraceae bacterium]